MTSLPATLKHFADPIVENPVGLPAARLLSWLYLLYAIPMIFFLAVAMPPATHYFASCEQCGYDDEGPREWNA